MANPSDGTNQTKYGNYVLSINNYWRFIQDRPVGIGMTGMAAGLLVLIAGLLLHSPVGIGFGVCVLSVSSLFYMGLIARVFSK